MPKPSKKPTKRTLAELRKMGAIAPKPGTKPARERKDAKVIPIKRNDGWFNSIVGAGSAQYDKRESDQVKCPKEWSIEDLDNLYRTSDLARKIVDRLPDEMVREWFTIKQEGMDPGAMSDVMQALDDLHAETHFADAMRWARHYGGAVIFIGADDGMDDPSQPLNENNIRSVPFLQVLDRFEILPEGKIGDMGPFFGMPEYYRILPEYAATEGKSETQIQSLITGQPLIHHSRIIRFDGARTPRRSRLRNRGWCDSIFIALWDVLRDYVGTWDAGSQLMYDFVVSVLKIEGLAEAMASGNDQLIRDRIRMANFSKSILRAVALDAGNGQPGTGEEFERKTTEMGGMVDFIKEFHFRLSAAAEEPAMILFGMSPAGFSSGEGELRWFYDRTSALQRTNLKPKLDRLLKILFAAKEGPTKGKAPKKWSIKFNPLWQLNDSEKADLRLKQSQTDKNYVDSQVLLPEEVAQSRFTAEGYSTETQIDDELRKAAAEQAQAQAEMEAEAAAAAAKASGKGEPDGAADPGETNATE